MNAIPIYQIDAFTSKVFSGNPAAVCILPKKWLPEAMMQNIAAENNLSETAFILRENEYYKIRWFTPNYEVNICGHGTLAAAYVIFNFVEPKANSITFQSQSGLLNVTKNQRQYTLDFPTTSFKKIALPPELKTAINTEPKFSYFANGRYLLVYENENDIMNLTFDRSCLQGFEPAKFCVTAPSDSFDFVTRYFIPLENRFEDPVTGSNLCFLAPYWAKQLNKTIFKVAQRSKRGGIMECELVNDRVKISGEACLYLEGTLFI